MSSRNRVGIYCNPKATPPVDIIEQVISQVYVHGGEIVFHNELYNKLEVLKPGQFSKNTFCCPKESTPKIDVLMSIGGDGTFLGTVPYAIDGDIPVIGLNIGRLGFLANASQDQISSTIQNWFNGNYQIDERMLLEILPNDENTLQIPNFCALNDITIRRPDSASMMTFKVEVNGQFLNNYWADGLIIATPTGSTAYSLSCGGPILAPDTAAFVITPIASHNLTVRPLAVSDQSKISILISGRSDHFSLSIDSESYIIPSNEIIQIQKSKHTIKTVRCNELSFYDAIRDKLSWGVDKRN